MCLVHFSDGIVFTLAPPSGRHFCIQISVTQDVLYSLIFFQASGVPALLVYRSGELVANFVRLTDTLGDDFYASDLEGFLIENGVLSDGKLVPSIIRGPAVQNDDSDSD